MATCTQRDHAVQNLQIPVIVKPYDRVLSGANSNGTGDIPVVLRDKEKRSDFMPLTLIDATREVDKR